MGIETEEDPQTGEAFMLYEYKHEYQKGQVVIRLDAERAIFTSTQVGEADFASPMLRSK